MAYLQIPFFDFVQAMTSVADPARREIGNRRTQAPARETAPRRR